MAKHRRHELEKASKLKKEIRSQRRAIRRSATDNKDKDVFVYLRGLERQLKAM